MKRKNYFSAILLGLCCHLLIAGLNRSITERFPHPIIKTSLYGIGLLFFGLGPFVQKLGKVFSSNFGLIITCIILMLFALISWIPVTVINWNVLFSRLLDNQKAAGSYFNSDGIILLIAFTILGGIFFLLLGNRFGDLLKSRVNSILVLFAYSLGFFLAILLIAPLITRFGPAGLLTLGILFFLVYLWVQTSRMYVIVTMGLVFFIALISWRGDFAKIYTMQINGYKKVLTIWSPYNRLDFIRYAHRSGSECLTAIYNFYPMWSSSEDIGIEDRLRRHLTQRRSRQEDRILVLGSGGGISIRNLLEDNPNAKIIVNEIDPQVIRLMKGALSRFNGNVYNDPRVEIYPGDGRLVLDRLAKKNHRFDLIIYDGLDTKNISLPYSLVPIENYLLTREAFESIGKLLKPGGIFLNYLTARKTKDINYALSGMDGLFSSRMLFSRLSLIPPFEGLPLCYIVSAKNERGITDYFSQIPSLGPQYDFQRLSGDYRGIFLTDNKPILTNGFLKFILGLGIFFTFAVSAYYLNLTRKSEGWGLAVTSFFSGIGYILVELFILDRIARSFQDPGFGQTVCISVFLFGQILAIYLLLRSAQISRQLIWISPFLIGVTFLAIPRALPYSLVITFLAGLICGIYFPYILATSRQTSNEKLYGLDGLGSVMGLFGYYLVVIIWGFQALLMTVISCYLVISLVLILLTPRLRLSQVIR